MVDHGSRLAARRELITTGPVRSVLWRLTLPAAVWYLLNYSFFVADTYFVGMMGTDSLAAMSLVSAAIVLITTLAQGFGSALAAIASIHLGAGHHATAAKLVTHTLLLGALVSLAVAIVGIPTIDPLFLGLGATEAQLPQIRQYMTVAYAGFVFLVLPTIGQSAIRATGDAMTPALILLASGAVHVLLDPILIFGLGPAPAMGLSGAAVAAVVARIFGTVATLWVLSRRDGLIEFRQRAGMRASWFAISRIGLPVACQMASLSFVIAINLRIAAGIGPEAIAGLGVGYRIEAVLNALVFGLPIILPTFIGQNASAGHRHRAGRGVLVGTQLVVGCQLGIAALVALLASPLSAAFSDDPRVQAVIRDFLWVVPISTAAQGFLSAAAGTCIGLGRIGSYLLVSAIPAFSALVLCWLAAGWFGISGLIGAISIARIAFGAAASFWLRRILVSAQLLPGEPRAADIAPPVGA